MRRTMMSMGGAVLLAVVTSGCGGDETALPVASAQTTSTTERPLFTRNATVAIPATDPGPTRTPPASSSSAVAAATIAATETATTAERASSAPSDEPGTATTAVAGTLSAAPDASTSTGVPTGAGDIVVDAVDAGVLAMKNFIVRMLGDGIRIVYDDIDLDDTELACVGRAEAVGIAVDEFDDVLFDCLDDDSFDTIVRAGTDDGEGDP